MHGETAKLFDYIVHFRLFIQGDTSGVNRSWPWLISLTFHLGRSLLMNVLYTPFMFT